MKKISKSSIIIIFLLCFISSANAMSSSPSLPTPVVRFPFDISKIDNIMQYFRIENPRDYIFALQFNYSGYNDEMRMDQLIGTGTRDRDGSYAEPGISVPIKITITKIYPEKKTKIIYDKTINSEGRYAHGFVNKFDGYYEREITTIFLEPGTYKVEAKTIKNIQEFSGIKTHLLITWRTFK